MEEKTIRYTTAPEQYDYTGFGTKHLRVVGTLGGQDLREVEIELSFLRQQDGRYGSGMYPCFRYDELKEFYGLPTFKPVEGLFNNGGVKDYDEAEIDKYSAD